MAEHCDQPKRKETEEKDPVDSDIKKQKVENNEAVDWKVDPQTAVSEVAFMTMEFMQKPLETLNTEVNKFFYLVMNEHIKAKARDFSDPSKVHMENYAKRTLQSWKRHPRIMYLELLAHYRTLENFSDKLFDFIAECSKIVSDDTKATLAQRYGYLVSYKAKEKFEDIIKENDSDYAYRESELNEDSSDDSDVVAADDSGDSEIGHDDDDDGDSHHSNDINRKPADAVVDTVTAAVVEDIVDSGESKLPV